MNFCRAPSKESDEFMISSSVSARSSFISLFSLSLLSILLIYYFISFFRRRSLSFALGFRLKNCPAKGCSYWVAVPFSAWCKFFYCFFGWPGILASIPISHSVLSACWVFLPTSKGLPESGSKPGTSTSPRLLMNLL